MSTLFTPLKLRELTIRNRIFVSPMCQYSADNGIANDWHLVHLGSRAVGGAGVVIVEATAVAPEGRITPGCLGLWSDEHAHAFAPVAKFIKAHGAAPAIQLAHAGRKASTELPWQSGKQLSPKEGGWQTIAPSRIPFADGFNAPLALDVNSIENVIEQFASAAVRALNAGFEVVEVHMAHGYLLHEFLSPITNRRSDSYGGDFENRIRLPMAVARKVREIWPASKPVFVRISATDWVDGGWELEQSIRLVKELKKIGIDFIDCSTGGLTPDAKIPAGTGFQTPFATAIKQQTGIATGAVGFITEPVQAEHIVATGLADAVLLAREMLRDPYWPLHAAHALGVDVTWPKQYTRAKPR